MKQLTQERRDSAMQDCTEWEGAVGGTCHTCSIFHKRGDSAMQDCTGWEGAGGRGGMFHTSCIIFHKRGETASCKNALVGRGQEAEEERAIHHAGSSTTEEKQRHARLH